MLYLAFGVGTCIRGIMVIMDIPSLLCVMKLVCKFAVGLFVMSVIMMLVMGMIVLSATFGTLIEKME